MSFCCVSAVTVRISTASRCPAGSSRIPSGPLEYPRASIICAARVIRIAHDAGLDRGVFRIARADDAMRRRDDAAQQAVRELLAVGGVGERLTELQICDDGRIRSKELRIHREPERAGGDLQAA